MTKHRNPSYTIYGTNGYWMRVYHRGGYTCYLCNFCPMGCNGLLPKLERIIRIEEVALFQDVNMAFVITRKGRGVPVSDMSEFLNSINTSENRIK